MTRPAWQIPRNGLLWLLIAFVAVTAPHGEHVPAWVTVACVISVIWRIQVYRGAWRYPGRWVKLSLMTLCGAGVLVTYGRLTGLEPMVALLVSAFGLKLLEMHNKRDALVVVLLGYFVGVLECLFYQTIAAAAYVFLSLVVVTAGLIGINQTDRQRRHFLPLKTAAVLTLQSIPLMIVLFLVMPRIGALWSVPFQQGSGVTGISESMSPGDFTRLGRSDAIAFRVEFQGSPPSRNQLYWRGLVFSRFDGRTWSQTGPWGFDSSYLKWAGENDPRWQPRIEREGSPVRYTITQEPTYSLWLFSLLAPQPLTAGTGMTRDYRLVNKGPVNSKMRYEVASWLDYRLEPRMLDSSRRRIELDLPRGFNPRTREIARQWGLEAPDTTALVARVLRLFNQEFTYTLQPPALGEHTVDEFLWRSRRGFCEHFAGSFVFFMRAAGVPARVVAGYQGGERHPTEGYITVRQYDAHAWAEIWLEGRGWMRVDPTAAVAPERIESSLADILGQEDEFLSDSPMSLMKYRHINWLNQLRIKLDYLDYLWAKWVLGYENIQSDFLTALLGGINPLRLGMVLLAAATITLIPVMASLVRTGGRRRIDPLDAQWLGLCARFARAGLPRKTGEGPRDYTRRVVARWPSLRGPMEAFTDCYEAMRFGPVEVDHAELRQRLSVLPRRIGR